MTDLQEKKLSTSSANNCVDSPTTTFNVRKIKSFLADSIIKPKKMEKKKGLGVKMEDGEEVWNIKSLQQLLELSIVLERRQCRQKVTSFRQQLSLSLSLKTEAFTYCEPTTTTTPNNKNQNYLLLFLSFRCSLEVTFLESFYYCTTPTPIV